MDKLIAMVREAREWAKGMEVYMPKGDIPDVGLQGIWRFWNAREKLLDVLLDLTKAQALMQEAARQIAKREEE